jgi:hypothetical protein
MSDRTPAQRARDDEFAYLAQCGLLPDPRDEQEWQDFYSRHHDFDVFAPPPPQGAERGQVWEDATALAGMPGPGPHSDHNEATAPRKDAAARPQRRKHDTEAHRAPGPHRRTRSTS